VLPDGLVTVVDVAWYGSNVVELTYKDAGGHLGSELLYRDREPTLEIATAGRPWSFDGDGAMLRLVSEAQRIRLAYLFDPVLAVHTSIVDPLPHQITAVYEEMLTRQPLRFLLADDPGAGKTIMAGLLIKELLIRGDLQRCLICCPGSLAEQWQDELYRRFGLSFDVITRESIESSRSGNPYAERNLVISRLDHMSRNEDIQAKLEQVEWDLVICDEAHKMSASFFGGEVKETKRYKLAKLLGAHERVHRAEERRTFSTQQVECQAESVAYYLCAALSIPCPNSPIYLALYKVSRATLAANINAIRAGVAALMEEILPALDAAHAA